jgi:hypothetical protein
MIVRFSHYKVFILLTIRKVSLCTFAIAFLGLALLGGCGGPETGPIANIPAMTPEELAAEETISETAE